MADNCVREYSTPERMKAAPKTGVTTAPTELKDWARFNRRSELSGGPRIVTYGLAATSRTPWPHAITNRANKKKRYTLADAAGMNKRAPAAQVIKPTRIPRLYPIFSISQPAGRAARKYPPKNAVCINDDRKSERRNAFFRWGIRISFKLTPNAQRKNRVVTRISGTT